MSEIISNIGSQKNIFFNKIDNYFNIMYESNSSKSVFNKCHQYLSHKEIEFDNVFEQAKKDNEDKNIICANFLVNNLLNFLNKKDINFDFEQFNDIKDDKIEKKKIKRYQDSSLNTINSFKNSCKDIKIDDKNQIKEILNMLKGKKISSKILKNKNPFNLINKINTVMFKNKIDDKKINNQFFLKEIKIGNIDKKNICVIQSEQYKTFVTNIKENKNNSLLSKNINKINNIIIPRNLNKIFNKKQYIKSNAKPLTLNDSQNSVEWKKLISHKILLSIANKDNRAEIYLKPESLGNIHIIINMENNAAILKFISKYKKIRIFLDNYMPFLRHSLMKNGIKLKNFDICSSLKTKKCKNDKNIYHSHNFAQYKPIDIYV